MCHINYYINKFDIATYIGLDVKLIPPLWTYLLINCTQQLSAYNQQDATFYSLFISVKRSTCFRRVFRPSSGAQNCIYSVRYLSDQYLTLYVQFWAPDHGRKNRLKHVERLTEINKLRNVASCLLYSEIAVQCVIILCVRLTVVSN